ncbi:MAG: hypothetical protein ACT6RL_14355 [Neoaquamicrobium sediminum]|uniref:Uncharacterized protein n=1 Tax=Neoaquamicrobium sediminum TaxID=1849104 RepID=A0ABV3WV83_9HYPH
MNASGGGSGEGAGLYRSVSLGWCRTGSNMTTGTGPARPIVGA